MDTLRFCFSGGEPLLAGLDFFRDVVEIQRELVGQRFRIRNTLQTNGTLIDREKAEFLRDAGFSVSLSIDGPAAVHDHQRPMQEGGVSSLERTVRGVRALTDAGMEFGTLTVVTSDSHSRAADVFSYLSSLSPQMMGFIPCVDRGPKVKPGQFGRFMVDLFDAWLEEDRPELRIREFMHIIQGMLGIHHRKGCQYGGDCPRHVNVAPDGSVSVCDQFIGKPEGYLGNVHDTGLDVIVGLPAYNEFRARTRQLPQPCLKCRYLALCNGGCAYRRGPDGARDYLCPDRQKMFAHIESRLDAIVSRMAATAKDLGQVSDAQDRSRHATEAPART
jgi:uncharacterized protein